MANGVSHGAERPVGPFDDDDARLASDGALPWSYVAQGGPNPVKDAYPRSLRISTISLDWGDDLPRFLAAPLHRLFPRGSSEPLRKRVTGDVVGAAQVEPNMLGGQSCVTGAVDCTLNLVVAKV